MIGILLYITSGTRDLLFFLISHRINNIYSSIFCLAQPDTYLKKQVPRCTQDLRNNSSAYSLIVLSFRRKLN
jgi:hypothetical protein